MNYKDIEFLSRSLDSAGRAFLNNRIANDRNRRSAVAERESDQRESLRNRQKEHYKFIEEQAKLEAAMKQLESVQEQITKSMQSVAAHVQAGKLDPDTASQYVLDAIPEGIRQQMIESQPELKLMANASFDWSTIPVNGEGDNMPTEWNRDPDQDYVTKGGSHIPPVKKSEPKVTVSTDEQGLTTRSITGTPAQLQGFGGVAASPSAPGARLRYNPETGKLEPVE